MISVSNASVKYGNKVALNEVSLDFPSGQVTALAGGDGAGKTTLLSVLAGRVQGLKIHDLPAQNIGYQPARSGTWAALSVQENLEFIAQIYGLETKLAQQRIEVGLQAAGLVEARNRPAAKLSGGMRQKLGFIMATLHQPELVLLDEPTTGVDPISRGELWNLIAAAAADGATVVMATTYLDEAERAQNMVLLDGGKVLASGKAQTIISEAAGDIWQSPVEVGGEQIKQFPYHWRQANTQFIWTEGEQPQGFSPAEPNLENTAIAMLMTDEPLSVATLPVDFSAGTGKLVEAENVSKSFGSFAALNQVSLLVQPGQVVGLLGGNGAGKTTLMRILLGLETPNAGVARLFGKKPSSAVRNKIGYVAQGMGLYPSLSAFENLQFAAGVYGVGDKKLLRQSAAEFGSGPVSSLPLGARRLLAFRAATLHRPQLLILDEPTSGMDPLGRAHLWQELGDIATQGVGILVTTHYMQEAAQCSQLVMLGAGKVLAAGTLDDVVGSGTSTLVSTPQWETAFQLLRNAGQAPLLYGINLRIPGGDEAEVRKILASVNPLQVSQVRATLDEAMLG